MYVRQLSLLQFLVWASYGQSEDICCCLQTCNVDVVLLVMYIPDKLVIVIFMLYGLRLVVVGAVVTLYSICVQTFVVTCASYRYI